MRYVWNRFSNVGNDFTNGSPLTCRPGLRCLESRTETIDEKTGPDVRLGIPRFRSVVSTRASRIVTHTRVRIDISTDIVSTHPRHGMYREAERGRHCFRTRETIDHVINDRRSSGAEGRGCTPTVENFHGLVPVRAGRGQYRVVCLGLGRACLQTTTVYRQWGVRRQRVTAGPCECRAKKRHFFVVVTSFER